MGIRKKPVYIRRIEDRNGKVLEERIPDAEGTIICTPEHAELMIEMLRGVVNEGTAAGLRKNNGITADIGGKTGTTQNYTDGWFIGFTPALVAGVWVGFMKSTFQDEHWSMLQADTFRINITTKEQLQCDDFREKKPFLFKPFQKLKEQKPFRNLFKRKRK